MLSHIASIIERREDCQNDEIEEMLHEAKGNHILHTHPEQNSIRVHLRTLKVRRDRDVRQWLAKLAKNDPSVAAKFQRVDKITSHNAKTQSNADYMAMLMKKHPDFEAIFASYANLREFIKNGYRPADQETDE